MYDSSSFFLRKGEGDHDSTFAFLSGFQHASLFCNHSPLIGPRKVIDFVCSTFFLVVKMGVTTSQLSHVRTEIRSLISFYF